MAPGQRPQSARPPLHGGPLRREIAASHRRRAHIGENDALEIRRETRRRDDEAFLVQLARAGRHASRRHPADIGMVGSHDAVSGDATLDVDRDRKSTRLNSSHSQISYAVFCLKKKKKKHKHTKRTKKTKVKR